MHRSALTIAVDADTNHRRVMGRKPTVPLNKFGVAIRGLIDRSPKFKNRSEFCRKIPITEKTLHRYETGEQSPTLEQLRMFASELDASISELVGESPLPSTEPAPEFLEWLAGPPKRQISSEEYRMLSTIWTRKDRRPTSDFYSMALGMHRSLMTAGEIMSVEEHDHAIRNNLPEPPPHRLRAKPLRKPD